MISDQVSAAIGLFGVGVYLGSYAAVQSGWLRADRALYPLLNILAASCVLIELQRNYNLPSVLIQVSWITISLGGLIRLAYQRKSLRRWVANLQWRSSGRSVDVHVMRSRIYFERLCEDAMPLAHRPFDR
ncbi:MAG: hypothetical protein AAF922_00690 [Pseudomonadota bacterium]